MKTEDKITGQEPASDMTISQTALKQFMSALSALPPNRPADTAREARTYVEHFIETCNGVTEEKINGQEPADGMSIGQVALKDFMAGLIVLPRKKPDEVADEAKTLVEHYIATCNGEPWNPGQSIDDDHNPDTPEQ